MEQSKAPLGSDSLLLSIPLEIVQHKTDNLGTHRQGLVHQMVVTVFDQADVTVWKLLLNKLQIKFPVNRGVFISLEDLDWH